jgi:hypothetical protein
MRPVEGTFIPRNKSRNSTVRAGGFSLNRDVAKHIHPPSSPPRLTLKMLGFLGVSKRFRIAYTAPGIGGRVVEGSGLEILPDTSRTSFLMPNFSIN